MSNTYQPISEVMIANFAATTLDDVQLTSLEDNTPLGRFLAREYGPCRDELLRKFPWPFAKRRAVLTPTATAPAFEYTYAYNLPNLCLRLLPITVDGLKYGEKVAFDLEGRQILTNEGPALKIRYIEKVQSPATFDPLFARALGQMLAVLAAQRVTGKASYHDKALRLYQMAIQEAYHVASLEGGPAEPVYQEEFPAESEFLSVRGF